MISSASIGYILSGIENRGISHTRNLYRPEEDRRDPSPPPQKLRRRNRGEALQVYPIGTRGSRWVGGQKIEGQVYDHGDNRWGVRYGSNLREQLTRSEMQRFVQGALWEPEGASRVLFAWYGERVSDLHTCMYCVNSFHEMPHTCLARPAWCPGMPHDCVYGDRGFVHEVFRACLGRDRSRV